jgi:hypothetical protein
LEIWKNILNLKEIFGVSGARGIALVGYYYVSILSVTPPSGRTCLSGTVQVFALEISGISFSFTLIEF